ncbi:MAG: DNA polymerase III subunit epsilon [Methylococcaceae bacterium]
MTDNKNLPKIIENSGLALHKTRSLLSITDKILASKRLAVVDEAWLDELIAWEHTHASRLIVLDTETTGLNPKDGNRIVEIGCVELIDRRLTGNNFHVYLNPERDSEECALRVHGLTTEFLSTKPKFDSIANAFIDYIQGSELIIHNAPFDVGFLNYELARLPNGLTIETCSTVFDTLADAKKRHPAQRNNLDALCKRYGVDNSNRELHGALLDAQILAEVFLMMTGGQFSLMNESRAAESDGVVFVG